jgi:LuxR family maltose regulon positive regulatory protein
VVLSPWREQVESKGWQDERLKVLVLQAIALQAHGEMDQAVHLLLDALALAELGGFIRLFVDEGRPMAHLLSKAAVLGRIPEYTGKLLADLKAEEQKREAPAARPVAQPLLEPLSPREVEVLQLMAQGLSAQPGMRLYFCYIQQAVQTEITGHTRDRVMSSTFNSSSDPEQPMI